MTVTNLCVEKLDSFFSTQCMSHNNQRFSHKNMNKDIEIDSNKLGAKATCMFKFDSRKRHKGL